MMEIGVISDTHGLLRPEAIDALQGVEHILHAGDVVGDDILPQLEAIAPVTAVRGNCDSGALARSLPITEAVQFEQATIYMIHIRESLDIDPASSGFQAVVFGHTHEPLCERRDGVLYLNPGSAGPRRFSLPITVARMRVDGVSVEAEIIGIEK